MLKCCGGSRFEGRRKRILRLTFHPVPRRDQPAWRFSRFGMRTKDSRGHYSSAPRYSLTRCQRHTALRPAQTHDGVVVALRSSIRWCSDHLEIHRTGSSSHARNHELVRLVFVIDAAIEKSSHGRQSPMPAFRAKWSAI